MPRYRMKETSFIDNRLVREGEEIDVAARHVPAEHWTPLDPAARKAYAKAGFKVIGPESATADDEGSEPGSPLPDDPPPAA
jgi:hypothetical protein